MLMTTTLFTVAMTLGALAPEDPAHGPTGPQPEGPIALAIASTVPPADQLSDRTLGPNLVPSSVRSTRPGPLVPLYASLAVLQGLDTYTTTKAISRGAVEANPVMAPTAGRTITSAVVKAAATAGSIYFVERAWKQNRKGAVILMTVINVATAAVVAHNTQIERRR